jgi:PAS domain-containing protein
VIGWVALPAVVVGLVGFVGAFALLLLTPARPSIGMTRLVRGLILAVLAMLVVSSALLFMSEADMEDLLGPASEPYVAALEDNIDTLFPLLVLGIAFAALSAQQYDDVVRSTRAHGRTHDLMMDIVEAAPAGILFLSSNGRIRFANDAAKHVLDLVESPESATVITPGWVVEDAESAEPGALLPLVHDHSYDGLPVALRWPSGWRVELRASGRPLVDATGELGGVVVTFERPSLRPDPAG